MRTMASRITRLTSVRTVPPAMELADSAVFGPLLLVGALDCPAVAGGLAGLTRLDDLLTVLNLVVGEVQGTNGEEQQAGDQTDHHPMPSSEHLTPWSLFVGTRILTERGSAVASGTPHDARLRRQVAAGRVTVTSRRAAGVRRERRPATNRRRERRAGSAGRPDAGVCPRTGSSSCSRGATFVGAARVVSGIQLGDARAPAGPSAQAPDATHAGPPATPDITVATAQPALDWVDQKQAEADALSGRAKRLQTLLVICGLVMIGYASSRAASRKPGQPSAGLPGGVRPRHHS
jgi:hypothetical protein